MMFSLNRILFFLTIFVAMLALPSFFAGWNGVVLLKNIPMHFIILFIVLTLTRWLSLIFRWYLLLKNTPYKQKTTSLFPMVLAVDFAGDNSPASVGNIVSTLVLFKQKNVPSTAIIPYGNLIFILDLAAVSTIILFALLFSLGDSMEIDTAAILAIVLIATIMLFLLLTVIYIDKLTFLLTKLPLPKNWLVEQRKQALYWWFRLSRNLKKSFRKNPKSILLVYLLSLTHWGVRFFILYLALLSLGAEASWPTTALIQFVSGMAGIFSLLPGGFPVIDISATVLLNTYLDMELILPAILLWRLASYHTNFIAGGISLLWLTRKKNDSQN